MNRLIATDAYHMTMGFLIEPDKALETETHILYARGGGPLVVADLSEVLAELLDWKLDMAEVEEADEYWSRQGVPFAREAWNKLTGIIEANSGRLPLSVRGVCDGEVMLPGDPIAIFEAPAILAAVIEPWLIGRMAKSLQLATRFTKLATAVDWDLSRVFEVGLRASQSTREHNQSVAILKKVGLLLTSSGEAARINDIAAGGSMGHRYTQRFSSDYEAFDNALQRMLEYRREKGIEQKVKLSLLLDTRSTLNSGLPAAIRLVRENRNALLHEVDLSVRLDSGDLEMQLRTLVNRFTRDIALPQLWPGIIIESGLTPEKVARLESVLAASGYPRNKVSYGLGGYLTGKLDRDFISLVYKLSGIEGRPVMKFADEQGRGKESWPGNVVLLERKLAHATRRLVAQEEEARTLAQYGWTNTFVTLVNNGEQLADNNAPGAMELIQRIRQRWQEVARSYIGQDKKPVGIALRPGSSPVTRRYIDWFRQYRLDATGREIPEVSCPIVSGNKNPATQKAVLDDNHNTRGREGIRLTQ